MVSGICPEWCCANCSLRKSERAGLTKNPPPLALCVARDWKLTEMLTGAALDCGLHPGRTSPALGWSIIAVKLSRREGGQQGRSVTGFLEQKYVKINVKTSILCPVWCSKRFRGCFCRNGYFFKSSTLEFCWEFVIKVGKVNFDLVRYSLG